MIVRSVRRDRRMASTAAPQVAAHEREVAGLDRHVGAGAHRQAEVGLGQRGGVVDAVADHRDDPALGLQAADDVDLVRRAAPRRSPRRCRPGRRRRGAARSLSPVSSTGSEAERAEPGDGLGRRRLDRVGDDEHGPRRAVPADEDRRAAGRLGRRRGRRSRRASRCSDQSARNRSRPATTAWPSTTPCTPRPVDVGERLDRQQLRRRGRRAGGDRPGDRVLGGVLERAGEQQSRRSASVAAGRDDVDERHRAGRDGAGLVEHDRVDRRGSTRAPPGP